MSDEGFLRRWARRKSAVREGRAPVSEPPPASAPEAVRTPVPQPQPFPRAGDAAVAAKTAGNADAAADAAPQPQANPQRPLPTMDDVATLDAGSDFSAFVARGVDQAVRRSALKKLFADPHFNVMDRLDVYIDDYTKPSPVSGEMLAALEHAKSAFMKLVEDKDDASLAPEAAHSEETQTQQAPEQGTQ